MRRITFGRCSVLLHDHTRVRVVSVKPSKPCCCLRQQLCLVARTRVALKNARNTFGYSISYRSLERPSA